MMCWRNGVLVNWKNDDLFSIISTCLNVSANIREETMRGKRDRYTGRNSHG